jgi:hypothetical protein
MKKSITAKLTIALILFAFTFSSAQSEQCGTMENLKFQLQKDPKLRSKLDSIEKVNELWIKNNNRGFKVHSSDMNNRSANNKNDITLRNTNSLCGYNNTLNTTINAPTALNQIISPANNCINGGQYVRVNNLIAGNVYRISTIGTNTFDTILSIFSAGGGNPLAYNDDASSTTTIQSEIYFNPFVSGNYDILIDQFGCTSNQLCASLQVELRYIPRPVITIPVVVHVIHNGENVDVGDNISEAQIQSQINVLNQDFRRLNSGALFSPAPFRGTSDDPLIQFCLAQQKPDGSPTNGIMRYLKPSEQDYIDSNTPTIYRCLNKFTIEAFKTTTIWNRDKYLNIWVSDLRQLGNCAMTAPTLGYAQLPGLPGQFPEQFPQEEYTDGIWISKNAFGTIGNLDLDFNLGKTTTHEVGHWLNLKHIWGDEDQCAEDDYVFDTPEQSTKSAGCNTFPFTDSCSILFPGIMFMNFMDYSDDNCLSIFTYGQTIRMDAALFNQRVGLLTSNGCEPSTLGLNDNSIENSIKAYPNPFSKQLTIEANEPIHKVEIYNLLGQKVKNIEIDNPTERTINIELSELSQGNYFAKIYQEVNVKTIKINKN